MSTKLLHRREQTIFTAIEIIDELGLQGLSTREIARRQDISEGTLFRHFKTKSEIVLAMLDYLLQRDADIIDSSSYLGLKPKAAIVHSIDAYMTFYEGYPAATAMTQVAGTLAFDTAFRDKILNLLANRRRFLIRMVHDGKTAGEIRGDADSESLADIITGTCETICLSWRMTAGSFSLREKTLKAINLLLDAISPVLN